jgi:transposase
MSGRRPSSQPVSPPAADAVIEAPIRKRAVAESPQPDKEAPWQRFFGFDIHKGYITIIALDRALNTLVTHKRMSWDEFALWAPRVLTKTDAVVIEMTANTWTVHDMIVDLVGKVVIVHPPNVARIMQRRGVKTDCSDARELARLLATGYLDDEGVWVPPQAVRELRTLTTSRYKLVRIRTQAKNRLHAILGRHHLPPPEGTVPFSKKHESFWLNLPKLSSAEKLEVKLNWETVHFAEAGIDALHDEIAKVAAHDPSIQILIQLPGFALDHAATVIAAIGDISRFAKARQLVGYAGLGSRVEQSGDKIWQGPITKKGRKDLRFTMVEAATHAVRHHKRWKKEFDTLCKRMDPGKAHVAIARKLLIVIWHILTSAAADIDGDPQQIAAAYMKLYYDIGPKNLKGLKPAEFVRQQLDDLNVGTTLKTVFYGKTRYLPASRHNPDESVATPIRDTRGKGGYKIGCASLKQAPDPRTFEGRLLSGRSNPEGAKKKRPLVGPRKKAAIPNPTG